MCEEVERLEHHADVGPQLREIRRPPSGSTLPSIVMVPSSIVSSRLMARHSVDLPDPDGPDHDDDLALADRGGDVFQHMQFPEVLVDVVDDNKWLHVFTQPHA